MGNFSERGQYTQGNDQERRRMNQAVFRQLYIFDDDIANARLSDLFGRLLSPELEDILDEEVTSDSLANLGRIAPVQSKRKNLRPEYQDVGSNFPTLVAGTGFEPATSGL
jgi:hypothetical protein